MFKIEMKDDKNSFLPGERITGRVSWSLNDNPSHIDLKLFWHTEGKGTVDVEIIDTSVFQSPPRDGNRDFSFNLPLMPYSFSGKLLSLIWALELIAEPSGESGKIEFILSPSGEEIILEETEIYESKG